MSFDTALAVVNTAHVERFSYRGENFNLLHPMGGIWLDLSEPEFGDFRSEDTLRLVRASSSAFAWTLAASERRVAIGAVDMVYLAG